MKKILTILILSLTFSLPAYADCKMGDAVDCTTKAKQGDAMAQNTLGYMYKTGIVVDKDYKKAIVWYTKAAEQGFATTQNNLGHMYSKGKGTAKNYIKAYMFFNIASANGDKIAEEIRDGMEKKMALSQIEKAQQLSEEWLEKHKNNFKS